MKSFSAKQPKGIRGGWLLLPLVLLVACTARNSQQPDAREVTLTFAPLRCLVPAQYQLTTPVRYIRMLQRLHGPAEVQVRTAQVEAMLAKGYLFDLYVDSLNADHTLWFVDGPYVRLNKDIIRYHVGTMEQTFRSQMESEGVTVRRIDNAFYNGRAAQLLKVKFEWRSGDVRSYTTEYILTTYTRSVLIMVNHSDPQDYEDLIRQVKASE